MKQLRKMGAESASIFWRLPSILCVGGMAGFALIVGLPARHVAFWPVTLLLMPIALLSVGLGWYFYIVAGIVGLIFHSLEKR